jgi:hypothetical protein
MSKNIRSAEWDRDCRALMDGLPATIAGRPMPAGRSWDLRLTQRAVDCLYIALSYSLRERTDIPEPAPVEAGSAVSDDELARMLVPALVATIRAAFKE